ncbi:MAG TPA: outer membrane lipoprotein chaperone LolA, partial [Acidobacteriota bacterium]|nr:outer membrane lipoprotein chaperone LolA [Acidobacteriota bacterium]
GRERRARLSRRNQARKIGPSGSLPQQRCAGIVAKCHVGAPLPSGRGSVGAVHKAFIVFAALALGFIFPGNLWGENSPDRLIDAIQKRYNSMGSFKADFVQIYRSGFSEEQESGTVYMKKPGKMRWEYISPTAKLFIADGKKTYFYVPRDKQVSVADWDADSDSTPLLFLIGRGDLKKDFDIVESRDAKLSDGDTVLLLTPKTEQGSFKEILLEARRNDARIVRLSVVEHNGNRNDYLLRSFQANAPVADDKFRFKIPKGVEVIRQ